MTNIELANKAREVAINYKTVYANGMFGQPITDSIIQQKAKQLSHWYTASRRAMLYGLVGQGYFGFDCVCFVKSITFWDWTGDASNVNGGAKYDGSTDYTEDGLLDKCTNVSDDFKNIEIGEYLWTDGHCGIYIGDGLAAECTPKWDNGVQITEVTNVGLLTMAKYGRTWKKHGKLPSVTYIKTEDKKDKAEIKPIEDSVLVPLLQLSKGKYRGNPLICTLQTLLKALGFYDMDIDGSFGPGTEKAVKEFQTKTKIACDGIVGYNTWCKLLAIQ